MNPTEGIVIRACASHDDLRQCVELQREVWQFSDEDLVPSALFIVARHTGGHAYVALDGERAVGFALAFLGEHGGERVWHSHMVGVAPEYQNRGVGRRIKLHQRDEGLRCGIAVIEWTFDPLEARNAYFNIEKLGAVMRRYIPDCYGTSTSPLHGSLPTDRLVAEWNLGSERVRRAVSDGGCAAAVAPVEVAVGRKEISSQREMREQLTDLFARGFAITGFRRESGGIYLLERYED